MNNFNKTRILARFIQEVSSKGKADLDRHGRPRFPRISRVRKANQNVRRDGTISRTIGFMDTGKYPTGSVCSNSYDL
jgi:hypothetical protein